MDEQNKITWKLIDTYEREILQLFFPFAKFKSREFVTSNDLRATNFKAVISSVGLFENTDYKFNPDTHFIHFTSLPVLSQILKSGFLRMSDFNCLLDKSELHFGQKVFTTRKDDELEKIKASKKNQERFESLIGESLKVPRPCSSLADVSSPTNTSQTSLFFHVQLTSSALRPCRTCIRTSPA
jgi:hypothetical protein